MNLIASDNLLEYVINWVRCVPYFYHVSSAILCLFLYCTAIGKAR